jgi:hypothetical protein
MKANWYDVYLLQKGSDVPLAFTAVRFLAPLTSTFKEPRDERFPFLWMADVTSGGTNLSPMITSPL